jgi:acetylglutamate kinase
VNIQEPCPGLHASKKIVRRLRTVGIAAIAIAVVSASLVSWRGRGSEDLSNDPSTAGFNKANQRQMEIMYGKMGTITEDLVQHLKEPRTQAIIILLGGGLIAVACFYFARLVSCGDSSNNSEPAGEVRNRTEVQ